jgi:hypothetical protein
MSGGSIIAFCAIIPIAFLLRITKLNNLFNLIYLMIFLLFSIYLMFEYSHIILNTEVGHTSLARLELKAGGEDSRKNIYMNLLTSKNIILYLFTGEGSNIFVGDRVYSPHSGHLMLIYGFGLICYFMYMYIMFRKSKTVSWMNYLPIIPFLLGFTINIGIGELKFAVILYMIVAFIRIRCRQIYYSFPIKKR